MAQRESKVRGEYIYYGHKGQTQGQMEILAQQLAQAEAIANEFGRGVESKTMLVINNNTEKFSQFSDIDVKGIWLKDLKEPQFERIPWEEGIAVKCTVYGIAREIVSSTVNYKARVLCNGFDKNHERTDFKDGDDLFLSFSSPVDGYLAVYLLDASNTVFCVLPYYEQSNGIYEIKANLEYRLFSKEAAKGTKDEPYVDEYTMKSESGIETNMLYVIFSPNKFYKAIDSQGEDIQQLRNLSYADFNKWLGKCYSKDKDLTVSKFILNIAE